MGSNPSWATNFSDNSLTRKHILNIGVHIFRGAQCCPKSIHHVLGNFVKFHHAALQKVNRHGLRFVVVYDMRNISGWGVGNANNRHHRSILHS